MYLAQSTYDSIRDDPSKVVTYYNSTRSIFLSDLAMPGLSEEAVISAWCSVVAYGLASYGPGPQTTNLSLLLQSPTLACAHYVTLTWHLYEQFGLSTDNLTAVGWDSGAVGNHAQMLFSDGSSKLLLDPTIGLIVNGVTYLGLTYGTSYHDFRSFYSRNDITTFNHKVINAVSTGSYHIYDAIYRVPTFDNWLNHKPEYRGVTIEHGNNSQTIIGYLTSDRINTGDSDDIVYGGKGDDVLDGGSGADQLFGGLGDDRFYIDNVGDSANERVNEGTDIVYSSVDQFTLGANIENGYIKSIGEANLSGNSRKNVIFAGLGNNIIDGSYETDTVSYYYASNNGVKVSLATTAAQITGGSGTDTLYSIENLYGSNYDDKLIGNSGANRLVGYAGNDVLNVGGGNDTLVGGTGLDKFVFNTALNATTNKDTITDFNVVDDTIQLENGIMTRLGLTTGTLASAKFWKGAGVAAGHDADDRIVYNTTTGALYYDADGNGAGAAIQIALIGTATHAALTNADFVVI